MYRELRPTAGWPSAVLPLLLCVVICVVTAAASDTTPRRVLLVSPSVDGSAASIELLHLAKALRAAGWRVEQLAMAGGSLAAAVRAAGVPLTVVQPAATRFCLDVVHTPVGGGSPGADSRSLVDPQAFDVILAHGAALDHAAGALWLLEQVESFGLAFTERLVWWIYEQPTDLTLGDLNFRMLTHDLRRHLVFSSEHVAGRWQRAVTHHIAACNGTFPYTAGNTSEHWHIIYPTLSYAAQAAPVTSTSGTSDGQRHASRAAARQALGLPLAAYIVLFVVPAADAREGLLQVLRAADAACQAASDQLQDRSSSSSGGIESSAAADGGFPRSYGPTPQLPANDVCPLLLCAHRATGGRPADDFPWDTNSSLLRALPADHIRFLARNSSGQQFDELLLAAADVLASSRCDDFGAEVLRAVSAGVPVIAGCACGFGPVAPSTSTHFTGREDLHHCNDDTAFVHLAGDIAQLDPRTRKGAAASAARLDDTRQALLRGRHAPERQLAEWAKVLGRALLNARRHDRREALRRQGWSQLTPTHGRRLRSSPGDGLWKGRDALGLLRAMSPSPRALARLGELLTEGGGTVRKETLSQGLHSVGTSARAGGTAAAAALRGISPAASAAATPPEAPLWQPPVTWRWRRRPDAPHVGMEALQAAVGQWLYIWGGYWKSNGVQQVMRRLDLASSDGRWLEVAAQLPDDLARTHAAVAVHLERYIYVVGGQVGPQCDPPTRGAYRFDIVTEAWQPLPLLPAIVFGAIGVISNDVLFVLTGSTSRVPSWEVSNLRLALPADGAPPEGPWRVLGEVPCPAVHQSLALLNGSGGLPVIQVFGGAESDVTAIDAAHGNHVCHYYHHSEQMVTCGVRTLVPGPPSAKGAVVAGSSTTSASEGKGGGKEGDGEVWEVDPSVEFPVGLSHAEACTVVLPGGRVVLFLGGAHELAWLSRIVYAYDLVRKAIRVVGLLPQGRVKGAMCGLWNETLWMALGQQSLLREGCLAGAGPSRILAQVWATPLPPELLA